jgi:hypothetical protein
MTQIKIFHCKICGFNKFRGTRGMVRQHIKEVHNIKGHQKAIDGTYMDSPITAQMGSREFK